MAGMKYLIGLVLFALAGSAAGAGVHEAPGAPRKKFIAFGWEFNVYKDPAFILANADLFESTGIDGVGFYPFGTNAVGATIRSVMHDDIWKREYFAPQVPIYRALTAKKGFRHSFLKCFHAPTNHIAWTDDAHWRKIAGSMETAAWLAKSGGMKGLCIDHEDYKGAEQFTRHEGELPYPELCALVRSRARQIFSGVFREFPDAVVLSYWFLSGCKSYFDAADPLALMSDKGDLWPAFFNGMLDAMPPTARFVDGNETAYSFEDRDFLLSSVQQRDRVIGVVDPANRDKYRAQLRVGFGLYLDSYVNPATKPDGTKNFFYKGPVNGSRLAHFEKNASAAAYAASEYVWLWGEKLCWTPWRTKVLKWLGGGKTWEQALPGLADVLTMIKDPDGFLVSRRERLLREGGFTELVSNPACDPATNLTAGLHMSTNAAAVPKPYIFWQAERRFRKGVAGVDVGGGRDGGTALVAKGVQNGTFVLHNKGVVPGEYYGVKVNVKGNAFVACGWQKNGVWQWSVPDVCLPLKGPKDGWRTASGLVRVPEEVDDLLVKVNIHQGVDEMTWVDDYSVACLVRFPPDRPDGAVWRPTERWRGFNLQDAHWKHGWVEFDEDDFAFMKEFGFNFARLPLSYRRWLKDPADWESIDPGKFAFLDRALELGRKYGIHIMVNLHRAPGYTVAGGKPEPASLWTSAEAERVFLKHWRFIAERYRDVPAALLSFNPVNEPPSGISEDVYARVMTNVVAAIRKISPDRFVVVDAQGGDRHPCRALFGARDVGQATRGYMPEAVSQWKPEREGKAQPLPEWPRVGTAPAGVLAGPSKPHLAAPLVLECGGPGTFTLRPGRVSSACTLVAKSAGRELSRLVLDPKEGDAKWQNVKTFRQWNTAQGDYLGEWRIALPAGAKEISVICAKGDWLDLREIAFANADGTKRVTLPFYHRFAPPVNFRQRLKGWAGEAKGFFPVDAAGKWEPVRYRDPGKEYLYRHVVKAWEEPMKGGVFAFCGEMGPENGTPHNIQLALLEDYLQLFKERNMGWAIWQLRGETGVMDSMRKDVDYRSWRGHKLDREMLELLQRY